MFNARTIIIAAALTFAGGAVTAASLSTTDVPAAGRDCSSQTWPRISAPCLDGATDRAVRTVSVDRTNADDMAVRFEVAFQ